MYGGYRVEVVIPAGRERTMSLLMKYLDREHHKGVLDKVQIWENTKDENDLEYLRSLPMSYPGWVEVVPPIGEWLEPKQRNTGKFYVGCVREDTVYIRFDDDIVYLHEDALTNLLDLRLRDTDLFLVFATIWNNAIVSYLMQQAGHIDESFGKVREPYCMDPIGWGSPEFGAYVHEVLLAAIEDDRVEDLYVEHYPLTDALRFSISCFAFFGYHMNFLLNVANPPPPPMPEHDEEVWLAEILPRHYGWLNMICGDAIVSHLTFFTQRKYIIERTDILPRYKDLAARKHMEGYYDMLPVGEEAS